MQCFICEISEEKRELVDVIFKGAIRKVCKNCAARENLHILKKSIVTKRLENLEKKGSVRERLASLSGFDLNKERERKSPELKNQEKELEKFINKNTRDVFIKPEKDSNLIRNFHWFIFRERRNRKLTQKELAKSIAEPEIVIKKLEQGEVPRERERLIKKIENYLGIKITKNTIYESAKNLSEKEEIKETQIKDFDPVTTKIFTIGDLRRMRKNRKRFL